MACFYLPTHRAMQNIEIFLDILMPYRLILHMKDGDLGSPYIAPNNPKHSYEHPKIVKEIHRLGRSMEKTVAGVVGYDCVHSEKFLKIL